MTGGNRTRVLAEPKVSYLPGTAGWIGIDKGPSPREGGWEILQLNYYKLCTLMQAAGIMPSGIMPSDRYSCTMN